MPASLPASYCRQALSHLLSLPVDSLSKAHGQELLTLVASTIQHALHQARGYAIDSQRLTLLHQVTVLQQQQQNVIQQLAAGQQPVSWLVLRTSLKVTLDLLALP